uniref:Uncharacterized protein n=1 Tax=Nelumbo nucifera TaxID=4432 RepID=A0A822XVR3_NELNU|nr:TPA_asm: hypothetical protein HUJ06_024539 [Nelumbo nucifera]
MSGGARICKFETAFKSMQKNAFTESGKANQIRRFSATMVQAAKRRNGDEKRRREAEKAENVMHLICWGPN